MADKRYAHYFFGISMWVKCLDCKVEIFERRVGSGGVNHSAITRVIELHESTWHESSDD
jgi:hypothetical protein